MVFDACYKAHVSLPAEVEKYFENGVCREGVPSPIKTEEVHDIHVTWYVVDIEDLPKGTTKLRFGVSS